MDRLVEMVSVGVILAAGGSRRMGVPKALLPVGGVPLVRLHEATLRPFCHTVRVVLGGWGAELDAALSPRAQRVHNPRWAETGPAESLLLAVADLRAEARVLVTPVDVPPAPRSALRDLVYRAQGVPPAVVSHAGQHGHPVLVTAGAIQDQVPRGETLRTILGASPRLVEAGTADVLRNLNTPAEWEAWTGHLPPQAIPPLDDTTVACPRCHALTSRADLMGILRPIVGNDPGRLADALEDLLHRNESSSPRWACTRCIDEGHAVPADMTRQRRTFGPPCYVYVSRTGICVDCQQSFVHTAQEQRRWYEEYGIFLYDGPRSPYACLDCRRARRQGRRAQAQLVEALRGLTPGDPEALRGVAERYRAIGAHRKAEEFLRRARNRARDAQERAELEALLAAWLATEGGHG